ncbi:MAG: FAD-dependent thymidylate synthase [Candidatus Omnitrophica bacterium]|nr:FAD-dependent thymidylate synthase [Candidatus Omnitrophota bacterium]
MNIPSHTQPAVRLVNSFFQPYNNAVATARTCYSSRVMTEVDVDRDDASRALRDRIAQSTYQAGHHTTLQHATFQFVLEKVSRQFLWSFLHSHPFYNSEQVSQRYVEVKPGNYWIPPLEPAALEIYEAVAQKQMEAYHRLIEMLTPIATGAYKRIFPNRRIEEARWKGAIKKKVQEIARYVLPVATFAHLYHTVSGITLHRYHRLLNQLDTPFEQAQVITQMIEEVKKADPLFFKDIEDPIPIEETLEYQMFRSFHDRKNGSTFSQEFIREFDESLGPYRSKLIDYKVNAAQTMAASVRNVLGISRQDMTDEDAIDRVMNPAKNPYLKESLNLSTLSKLTRTMHHAHFTFRKKQSHTADSQDQRHRMTPGSRPILEAHFRPGTPDFITPPLVTQEAEAHALYVKIHEETWEGIRKLLELGVKKEFALYLLPNSFPIRFEESGDLLNLHHKWVHRLCYTAQEEIWRTCLDEVLQVEKVQPLFIRHIHPPCQMRFKAHAAPFCPEGERFCGIPVWKLKQSQYQRTL